MSLLNPRTGRNRWWVIPIIGLVVIVTGVLVALAIAPQDPPESELIPWTPTPRVEPTATAMPETEQTAVPQQRFLAAVDGSVAWRVDVGACPELATWPELTTNGGGSWARSDASTETGSAGVLAMGALSADIMGMVTFNTETCSSPQFTSLVGGEWAPVSNEAIATTWYFIPGQGPTIYLAGAPATAPCEPAGIATRSATEIAVLCTDASVVRSVDGAVSWLDGYDVAGASVITTTTEGYLVGGVGQARCTGVELRVLTAAPSNGDGELTGCFQSAATPGNVAISSTPGALWVWAGTSLGISPDGGESW